MKNIIIISMFILVLTACNKSEPLATTTSTSTEEATISDTDSVQDTNEVELLMLTLEELSNYNGKNGQPAYVAIDGIIYDMTGSELWANGDHNGFEAGKNLTDPLNNQSPHGSVKLKNVPVVGELVEASSSSVENNKDNDASADTSTEETTIAPETEQLMLTLSELAQFNGKDGQPAYVAVEGIIYDMTNSDLWKDGGHNGFEAGNDLTEPLNNQSPHGSVKLENVPVVGQLIEEVSPLAKDDQTNESATSEATEETTTVSEPEKLMLTLNDLGKYNGKDGQPAYVAIEGIIYDMTDSDLWKNGGHNGFEAGNDLTEALNNQSPHGSVKLKNVPVVGQLIEEVTTTEEPTTETETQEEEEPVSNEPSDSNGNGLFEYSLDQLSQFTGKDGAPAYIGYKGLVYDVSHLGPWNGGQHNGNYAGFDLTDDLAYATHGEEKLDKAIIVGEIVQ